MSEAIAYYLDEPIYQKDISYQLYLLEGKDRPTAVLQSLLLRNIAERARELGLEADLPTVEAKLNSLKENGDLDAVLHVTDRSPDELRRELIQDELLNLCLTSEHDIDESDFEKFYEERFKGAKAPERAHLRHVLIMFDPEQKGKDRAEITAQMDEIEKSHMSFENKAMKYSECVSATNGGDLGWVKPKDLFPEIETAIRKMKAGDAPVRVETEIGLHLVELLDFKEESELPEEDSRKAARKRYNDLKNKTELRYIMEAIKRDIRYVGE